MKEIKKLEKENRRQHYELKKQSRNSKSRYRSAQLMQRKLEIKSMEPKPKKKKVKIATRKRPESSKPKINEQLDKTMEQQARLEEYTRVYSREARG